MATYNWTSAFDSTRKRLASVAQWAWFAIGAAVLALLGATVLLTNGPNYVPLYEGLSAKQGGQVINNLQKLGITYQLNSSGSIIEVPSTDLASARLKLGQMGVPVDSANQAWDKLMKSSLTTSQIAESALSKRAIENTLERSVAGIKGVAEARVTLAVPKSTPFLKSQPHPKASVWLRTVADGISATQARAIAQMVANSVPGLTPKRVTVTDQNGNVLAPSASQGVGQAQQQLAFEDQVEARAVHHIQALLAPMIGAKNLRVSAAASIDFSQVNERGVAYGPNQEMRHLEHDKKNQLGALDQALGVPGSLSNQPPGKASAPLQTKNQNTNQTNGQNKQSNAQQQLPPQPRSSSEKWNIDYRMNQTTQVKQGQPWALKALSVSVVLNKNAAGANPRWVKQVRAIVAHAVTASKFKVNVAMVPFGVKTAAPPTQWPRSLLMNRELIQALMEVLAAFLILIGVAGPMARWVKDAVPQLAPASAPALASEEQPNKLQGAVDELKKKQVEKLQRARQIAHANPKDAAEMIKGWLSDKRDAPIEAPSEVKESQL